MEFSEKHVATIDNLLRTLLRCQLPEANGEEYLAFAQSYYFLHDLKTHVAKAIEEQKRVQTASQQLAEPTPPVISNPTKNKKSKKK